MKSNIENKATIDLNKIHICTFNMQVNLIKITALSAKTYERIYVINGYKITQERKSSSLFFVYVAESFPFFKGIIKDISHRFPFLRSVIPVIGWNFMNMVW